VPAYNEEKVIGDTVMRVGSYLEAMPEPELIIVDDGSSDSSLSIAQKYRSTYQNKIRILTQSNQGPSVARNNAIRQSSGDLIAFIDSDDLWSPDKLESQVNLLKRHDNVGFIYSGYFVINECGDIIRECKPESTMQGLIYEKLWTVDNTISGGTLLVPKSNMIAAGCFDENLRGAENLDLRIRLSKLGEVYYVDKCLYYYRRHDSNLTTNCSAMTDAQLMLINKHFNQNSSVNQTLHRYVLSKYYYGIGVNEFSKMNLNIAMPYFCRAIMKSPLTMKYYVRLSRCLLGVKINTFLSKIKQ
jgi:glycosyltransferase involved in cell wall biosynthesis